jgi:hypothetical protein
MKIIHLAYSHNQLIKLIENENKQFIWENISEPFPTLESAMKWGWKNIEGFIPLNCGYKFVLPERDEHGKEAFFIDAVRSLNSMNGIFFDETLGHNVIVHQIPEKTKILARTLK